MLAGSSTQQQPDSKDDVLSHIFGFSAFRPGQEPVVDALLNGQNVLAVMPTGAGKSLCFQLPAIMRPGLTVVVSPLIALMENQVALLQSFGVRAGMIHSGRLRSENVADWRAVAAGDVSLLYMSPERLVSSRMIEALRCLDLSMVVIDEAHCISQWGHDFRKEYMQLGELKGLFPDAQLAAFTATADESTRQDIVERIFHKDARVFVQGFDRPNIAIKVEEKRQADKRLAALVRERKGRQGIIYCLSRKGTEKAADLLAGEGHNAIAYHAGLSDEERTIRLNRFLTEPDLIVCATIAFGMGIDKPDIRYVIHMNLPASLETYYQEIGRAGRDGEPAEAILLYGYNDLRLRRTMIDDSGAPEEVKRVERRRLDRLAMYCETVVCRRNELLAYFGEEQAEPCGNCDICDVPPLMVDGTEDARLALATIMASGEIYGQSHIISILRGANTQKVRSAGHNTLQHYGQGEKYTEKQWRRLFRQMLAQGVIAPVGDFGSLTLTARGQQVLAGAAPVSFRQDALGQERSSAKRKRLAAGQVDAKLLTRLKEKRLELAREKQCPAYVVFSDRTLIDMAEKQPKDLNGFTALYGVGDKKAEAYADMFLAVIAEYTCMTSS